jgi:serine/threonine protein kinase
MQPIATLDRGWLSLAKDESTGRTVALKIVRMTAELDPGVLRRFEHEYGALSALKNANVMRIYKHGVVENCVFIAMEYCTGGDLEERLERGTSMEEAVDYLVQIMQGLKAVHARDVLHRDLKPTNLLFRENGTLVLTDFGIERDISDNPRLTSTRSLVSDLGYVSSAVREPERHSDAGGSSQRPDPAAAALGGRAAAAHRRAAREAAGRPLSKRRRGARRHRMVDRCECLK